MTGAEKLAAFGKHFLENWHEGPMLLAAILVARWLGLWGG